MNLSRLLEILDQLPAYRQAIDRLEDGPVLTLPAAARPPVLAGLFLAAGRTTLLVTGRVEAVPIWQQALEAWLPAGQQILRFPEPTPLPYERGPWSDRSRHGRLGVLAGLVAREHPLLPEPERRPLILTSARALLQKTSPKRRFLAATRVLRPGQLLDVEKLMRTWQDASYEPSSVVESPGQFSRRGGIIDIYPVGATHPVRIELFGDEVETLRAFDPSTQRTIVPDETAGAALPGMASGAGGDGAALLLSDVVVPPAREALQGDARPLGQHLAALSTPLEGELPGWRDDVADLAAGRLSPYLEYYLPMIYRPPASLLEYLPQDALLVVDDLPELEAAVSELESHAAQLASEQSSSQNSALPPDFPSPLFDWKSFSGRLLSQSPVILGRENEEALGRELALASAFQPGSRFGGQVRPFLLQLRFSRESRERTVVVSRQVQRLAELWREEAGRDAFADGPPAPVEALAVLPPEGEIAFVQGSLAEGFTLERPGTDGRERVLLHLLTDAEIFGWSRPAPRRWAAPRPVAPERYFADITAGDHVVHSEYGIGRFAGLAVRAVGGTEREYLQVYFGNGDVLYVPAHHADRLSKWIGPDDRRPELHRLGEKRWKQARTRAQQAVNELADELLDLYAARETIAGHAFAGDSQWQAELEASFAYQETEDQLRAIAEVKADMERPYPMDRLICGDVGYGKTEVALRAAFKAVMDGKQVAMLVPTTVLAQQHYNTFLERLEPFPVNLEMLSRFRTQAHQERIIRELLEGRVDIVIGTHRLLSDDVAFKDLGLLIIDEEQRFGVSHKEQLKQLRTEVDVLTMTATPIPRTLYMSLTGARDVSIIDTPPADRLPVQTYVGEADETMLRRAILRELDRGGQVYYVHNRVQTIENAYVKLSGLVPEAFIAIGHGQMSERELEDVMLNFVAGKVDVLLSTTIIESGLDIPNANTLIVDRADQFGLAQLYQLRGRVGRGARRAYAYFFHSPWHKLTADAQSRLEVIANQTDLGAGYSIAMRDLEIRGAGDLLGARQSGHIAAIGFDLYARLLAQAVKRRRAARTGERVPVAPTEAVLIDLPLAAYIPTDYVPDAALRLRLYRRMAGLDSLEEVDEMAAELADRFGTIPDPIDNLLYQLRVKVLANQASVAAVTTENGQLQIRLSDFEQLNRFALQRYLGRQVRVSRKAVWMGLGLATHEWQVTLVQVLEKLRAFERN